MGLGMHVNRYRKDRGASSLRFGMAFFILSICALLLSACMGSGYVGESTANSGSSSADANVTQIAEASGNLVVLPGEDTAKNELTHAFLQALATDAASTIHADALPAYDGNASVSLNDDVPFFDSQGALPYGNDYYSKLDLLGRCRTACAIVGAETMPVQHRGSIGDIKPSGWRISKYDWIDGKYLFNRCHLIGYQLTGQNANECNLITGTRYLNVEVMQPFENDMADYVRRTGNHVLYRVTPVFEGIEPIARGVVMEACSLEDEGAGVQFCRWCPNIQPGVVIDYLTGKNKLDEDNPINLSKNGVEGEDSGRQEAQSDAGMPAFEGEHAEENPDFDPNAEYDYILNKNSHLIHLPTCDKVGEMKSKNKLGFNGTREEVQALVEEGDYRLCRYCNP